MSDMVESAPRPTPADLPRFLPYACAQLLAPFDLRLVVRIQEEYISKVNEDKGKKTPKAKSTVLQQTSRQESILNDNSASLTPAPSRDTNEILVEAVCDVAGHLLELNFNRCPQLPRLLIKVIGLCVPFQPLLYKLAVRWGPLEGETLYEISKLVPQSLLTEIELDDSPVAHCNYYLLLEHESHLRYLSLARCKIADEGCILIASKLKYPLPAAMSLVALSLTGNCITNVGAAALGEALRSNRCLRHLNLSGNRIEDEGAVCILKSLMEFPLTYEELISKRRRLTDYIILKNEVYKKCYNELLAASEKGTDEYSRVSRRKTTVRSRKTSTMALTKGSSGQDMVAAKAETMAMDLIGAYSDPFRAEDTVSRATDVYSAGNLSVCWLNLSYNNLGYPSAVKLREVLEHQRGAGRGLARVRLEGNALPAACAELLGAGDLLEGALGGRLARLQAPRRSDRTSKPHSKAGK